MDLRCVSCVIFYWLASSGNAEKTTNMYDIRRIRTKAKVDGIDDVTMKTNAMFFFIILDEENRERTKTAYDESINEHVLLPKTKKKKSTMINPFYLYKIVVSLHTNKNEPTTISRENLFVDTLVTLPKTYSIQG